MNTNIEQFKSLMVFNTDLSGHISCEREFFLVDEKGKLNPGAPRFLNEVNDKEYFSYELSACQVEYKTGPQKNVSALLKKIEELEKFCRKVESTTGLYRTLIEVAPDDMPRDVYPDERYLAFQKTKTDNQLLAMLQVTACQFHVGMPNYETARQVYNSLIPYIEELISLCNHSNGRRMTLYKQAAPHYQPIPIESIEDHYQQACKQGYVGDLKSCHSLIRITHYGTIEFRMFGAAQTLTEIENLGKKVLSLCIGN